jgi:hypothetical protein
VSPVRDFHSRADGSTGLERDSLAAATSGVRLHSHLTKRTELFLLGVPSGKDEFVPGFAYRRYSSRMCGTEHRDEF